MGSTKSPAEFGKRIISVATSTERNTPIVVRNAAAEARRIFLTTAEARGMHQGGKLAKRNWGVRYDLVGKESALVRFTGPFHLVEADNKGHGIVPKNAQALRFGDRFAESVIHPGTKGKHIFSDAKQVIRAELPKKMAAELRKGWVDALK